MSTLFTDYSDAKMAKKCRSNSSFTLHHFPNPEQKATNSRNPRQKGHT